MRTSSSRQADKFIIRLPDGMRERIRERALVNRRTMNSEIVHYLDRALTADENESPAAASTAPGSDHQPTLEKADEHLIA